MTAASLSKYFEEYDATLYDKKVGKLKYKYKFTRELITIKRKNQSKKINV